MHNLIMKITRTLKYIMMIMMMISLASSESFAKPKIHKPGNPIKAASKATKSAERGASKGAKSSVKAAKSSGKAAKSAEKGTVKGAKATGKGVSKGAKATGKGVSKGAKGAEKGAEKGAKGIEAKIEKELKKLLSNTKFLESLLNPALSAAKLPNIQDIKLTARCIIPTVNDLRALLLKVKKDPTDPSIDSLLERMRTGKCRGEVSALAQDCTGPGVMVGSMTPAGGFIGNVCGQITALDGRIDSTVAHVEQAQAQAKIAKKGAKAAKNGDLSGVKAAVAEEQSAQSGGDDSSDSDDSGDDSDSESDEG